MDFGERYGMTHFGGHSPRRYFVDKEDRHVQIGLTIGETFEFETLDSLPALDESGNHMAWDENGIPTITREKRWLELYSKHDEAWKGWMAETYADRPRKFGLHDQTEKFFRENQRMG
jgi:hypothetical protein